MPPRSPGLDTSTNRYSASSRWRYAPNPDQGVSDTRAVAVKNLIVLRAGPDKDELPDPPRQNDSYLGARYGSRSIRSRKGTSRFVGTTSKGSRGVSTKHGVPYADYGVWAVKIGISLRVRPAGTVIEVHKSSKPSSGSQTSK